VPIDKITDDQFLDDQWFLEESNHDPREIDIP